MYRALASQNYIMSMRESDFFSLIGTQHFGKLFSPDGENVACNDYYFLVAFYSFNTGNYTTFTKLCSHCYFVLSLRRFEPRVLSITFNFFLHFYFKRPPFDDRVCCSAISFNNYLSSLSVYEYI